MASAAMNSSTSSRSRSGEEALPSHIKATEDAPIGKKRRGPRRSPLFSCIHSTWVHFIDVIRSSITCFVRSIAVCAASYPTLCIFTILAATVATVVAGLKTNFELDLDVMQMFTPTTSLTTAHRQWAFVEAGFSRRDPLSFEKAQIILHKNDGNVLEMEGVKRLFQVLNVAMSMDRYKDICLDESFGEDVKDCDIQSLTRFWNNSQAMFEAQVSSDSDVIAKLSQENFPDGSVVDWNRLLGVHEEESNDTKALFLELNLPVQRLSYSRLYNFGTELTKRISDLRGAWSMEAGNEYRVEFTANFDLKDEFKDAIFADLPLLPVILLIMLIFTVAVFWKCHRVESRFLLAIGAVVTVFLSLGTGFGLMFILGLPYGVINNVLPFIVAGVGLDDTYIIHGAFSRTDRRKTPLERIKDTFDEVGLSIFMTTSTTSLAFALGCISTVPAIRNLCFYAFPTLMIDFVYQITFFVSLLALDEYRIEANRFDCCFCLVSSKQESCLEDELDSTATSADLDRSQGEYDSTIYRLGEVGMAWYADQLLRPWVKRFILALFAGFSALCIYSAFQVEQSFSFLDLLPDYSASKTYFTVRQNYGGIISDIFYVYFRDLNQSDPAIQDQIIDYLDQLSSIDHVVEEPFCWIRDVRLLQKNSLAFLEQAMRNPETAVILEENPDVYWFLKNESSIFEGMPTKDIINAFAEHERFRLIYGSQIVRNREGDVIHTRCGITIKDMNYNDIPEQLKLNRAYHALNKKHPLNQDRHYDHLHAFMYEDLLHLWDFFEVALTELKYTAFSGVGMVSFFSFLFVPHWTAVLYIFPLMGLLYADLLGLLHLSGLSINVLTYVVLVVSVGLLVDFVMHILLRFFEVEGKTKEEKIKNTLKSMGTAILLGGISTFLGTIPLFFSESYVFRTVCISFFSMVALGMSHGLILLPVLLSHFGGCGTSLTSKQDKIKKEESLQIVCEPRDSYDDNDDDNEYDGLKSPMSNASTAIESIESGIAPIELTSVRYIKQGTESNTFDHFEIQLDGSKATF